MPGKLVIISSPSGGGKNSVINALIKLIPNSGRLITTTTRPMRPNETADVDYYFISREEFEKKLNDGDFLEHNIYAGREYYGTDRVRLAEAQARYNIVFSQIEVNGKHQLDKLGMVHLAIFLLPESLDILKARITKRGGLTEDIIAERLRIAEAEIAESADYDYRIVNPEGKLTETVNEIYAILDKEGLLDKKTVI